MTFPDPSLLLAFFAGCFVTTLAFGIAEYRRKRKQDRWLKWASSIPPATDDEHWRVQ